MARNKVSEHIDIDTELKVLYVELSKLTEEEKALVDLNMKAGYAAVPKSNPSRARVANGKKRVKSAEAWKKILTPEQMEKFNSIKAAENYMKANAWALEQTKE